MKKVYSIFLASMLCLSTNVFAQDIMTQNFESSNIPALPTGWTQTTKATTGWKTNTGRLASTGSWFIPEHTKYAVVDDWNNNDLNDSTRLVSPTFSLVGHPNAFVILDYYFVAANYNGGPKESAYLQISTDNGNTWANIDTFKGSGDTWQLSAKSLSSYAGMATVRLGVFYNDGAGGSKKLIGCAVDNIKVYDPLSKDITLKSVTPVNGSPKDYGVSSSNLTVGGSILNYGSSTITDFTVFYQLGSGAVISSSINGISVPQFSTYDFTASNPLPLPGTLGTYPVNIWVVATGDGDATNDSNNTSVTTVTFMPNKKILVEEGTGTWCGWCPRGAVYMDSLWNTHPNDVSLVAVHNGDPMVVSAYDSWMGGKISGYPSVVVDRREVLDPSDLIDVYNNEHDYFGYANLTLTPMEAGSFNLSVKATVTPAIDLNGDYRLAMALVEDEVHGTASTYGQHNYYAGGGSGPLHGAGFEWENEASIIPAEDMYFKFVARGIYPSPTGAAGSLPGTMTAGTTYDYTFATTNIPQPYNRANMRYVVMLINAADGSVLNSNYATVVAGVSNVNAGINKFDVYPNPATDRTFVSFKLDDKATVFIEVIDALGRTVSSIPAQQMIAGTHNIEMNIANIAAGSYTVKMQTEKGAVTQHLSVIK
jgi:hypothetical protein